MGKKEEKLADDLLNIFGIEHIKDKFPADVSGGERQRTAVARALINNPLMILADEPTGNLDSRTTAEIMKMITGFARKYEQTIILVTHDPGMSRYADRIVTLVDGNIIGDERKR